MPTLAPDVQEVTTPIEALTVWRSLPDTKRRLQIALSEAVATTEQHIVSDTSLRVPRRPESRRGGFRPWLDAYAEGGFDQWLTSYKRQLSDQIQSEVTSAFPEIFTHLQNKDLIRETVESSLWPQIEPHLKRRAEDLLVAYAVRGIALAWVSRNISDGLLLGVPEKHDHGWCIPLHQRTTQTKVAEVVLDSDGEILSDAGTLRAEVEAVQ